MGSWDDVEPELNSSIDDVAPEEKGTRSQAVRANEAQIADLTQRLATLMVRRRCNQHDCTPATSADCDDRNHRKDADYLAETLDILGLPGNFPAVTADDRKNWLSGLKAVNLHIDINDLE